MEYGVSNIIVNPVPSQPQALTAKDADGWHTVFGSRGQSSAGVPVTSRTALGYPPFWRGVNLLTNGVSGLPLDVYRRKGDDRKIDRRHPAEKLLRRKASSILHAATFREVMQSHALLFGNGFAVIERGDMDEPLQLWILDPRAVMIRYLDGELWYSTLINGEKVRFPGRDIFHLKGLGPDGIVGYSAVDLFADALGVGMAAQQFGGRFFSQGGNASGVLMVPGSMSDDKIRNTIAAWEEMTTGLSAAHKIALLQEGVKYQQLSIDPDKAQFLETRGYEVRVTVAGILGVPPHMLGDDTRTSHNSLEAEEKSFLKYSLGPWLKRWEHQCNEKLLTDRQWEEDTHYCEYNREADVQMLFSEKMDGITKQIGSGLLSINEGRKLTNLPAINDGDTHFVPANWVELGKEPEPPPAPIVPAEPDEGDDEPDEAANILRAMVTTSVTDAIKLEQRRVVEIADKAKSFKAFCGKVESYYETWTTNAVKGLATESATTAKRSHVDESLRQLSQVASSCTDATLPGNVKSVVSSWGERAEQFVEGIMG